MLVDTGKEQINLMVAGNASLEEFDFGLYASPVTWAHGTTMSDLTEVSWVGYSRQTVPGWASPVLDGLNRAVAAAFPATITFTNLSGTAVTAQGWFAIGHTSGVLYAGDQFISPIAFDPVGTRDLVPSLITDTI